MLLSRGTLVTSDANFYKLFRSLLKTQCHDDELWSKGEFHVIVALTLDLSQRFGFTGYFNTHWIGGWVDPIAGLGPVKKRQIPALREIEIRLHNRPVRGLVTEMTERSQLTSKALRYWQMIALVIRSKHP